jgi:DNA ligase (NAD+)
MDIVGLGPKIIDLLIKEGLASSPADFYELKEGDLVPLERFAEKSAVNLIQAIEKSKKISLAKFIYALGILHVGEETAALLARNFQF